jgi:hypothetical protein
MAIDININSQVLPFADLASFPATGSVKTIYIAEDSDFSYYWDGTEYIQLSGGGGGSQDLQSVTDEGNTTTNNIEFNGNVGLIFDNSSKVTKGTTDSGTGGAGGVALKCSIDYELKWEAGNLYILEQDGFTIREVKYKRAITPSINDDSTKGFIVGSRWILDNATTYTCTDDTSGDAVWNLENYDSQNLQSVTDNGATTTNSLTIDSANAYSLIAPTEIGTEDKNSGTYAYLGSTGILGLKSGDYDSTLDNLEVNINGINLQIPDKASAGNYIIQTTEEKGNANGYASLDSGGKIPATQLPNSVMEFKGAWDASTNTPTLANGTGNAGDVYRCSVAGSVNFGAGAISFGVGDWVMYNGSIWQHSPATDAVTSVNGLTGAVTLTIPDAQIQSDWTQANTSALDYIKNKPNVLTPLGYYFAIQDFTTQDNPTANIPRAVKFDTIDLANGFSLQSETAIFTGTINNGGAGAGTTLTVTSITSGTLKVGMVLTGGSITAGTFISAFTSGTGGVGTYVVSISQNRTSATYTGQITSQIVCANSGVYNLQFSSQMDKSDSGVDYVDFWLRKNGVDVIGSAGTISLQGNSPAYMMAAWNYLLELSSGDIIELYWASADINMSITSQPLSTSPYPHPSIASSILTITQQAGVMAETQLDRLHAFASPYDYNGHASQGSSQSAAVWTITRLTLASDGTTTKGVATGAWTNRASLTYI